MNRKTDIETRFAGNKKYNSAIAVCLMMAYSNCGSEDISSDSNNELITYIACTEYANPANLGPSTCKIDELVRPKKGICEKFVDRTPNISPKVPYCGMYDGHRDRPNALPVGDDTLQICYVAIFDHGEEDGGFHGPYGSLHYDYFDSSEPLSFSPDRADRRRIEPDRLLRGPHRTKRVVFGPPITRPESASIQRGNAFSPVKRPDMNKVPSDVMLNSDQFMDEWLRDEALLYRNFGLLDWKNRAGIVLRIWESDGCEDGYNCKFPNWKRRNEVLGMELVSRAKTLRPEGQWLNLYKYTQDHPRRRTQTITGIILLKTGGSCPVITNQTKQSE